MLVFSSAMGRPNYFHANSRLAVIPIDGGLPRSITDTFDESPDIVAWNAAGLFFSGSQKTATHMFRVDPATGTFTRVTQPDALMLGGASFTNDGRTLAFTAPSPTSLNEVFISTVTPFAPRQLTTMTDQVKGWTLGTREMISWTSQDGTIIEGVLIKPAGFDPSKKYPLLCDHPRRPDRNRSADPPGDAATTRSTSGPRRGALILKVNYRGSAGYGEKFRQLNVRNLGVGDAWDVLSGVDHLIAKGLGGSETGRLHGLEPGRLHLRLPHDVVRPVRGDLGRRRHLELGDLLLQHRHHAVHDPVSRQGPGARPGDLRRRHRR